LLVAEEEVMKDLEQQGQVEPVVVELVFKTLQEQELLEQLILVVEVEDQDHHMLVLLVVQE
jgi:hypothetical protein